ncbi:unnamed protein product [Calypogeia fissa]
MDPAMFSVANMFGSESGDEEDDSFVERDHKFPGLVLRIREFAFHQVNANLLWPGATIFAEWIVAHKELIVGRHVLELGSGTGALAIFLKKAFELDITTSDYDDVEIEHNISKNCHLNGLAPLPHIRHTWGEVFPCATPDWDLIIASDILLYVKQYPNLIQTLSYLLKGYNAGSDHHARQNAHAREPVLTDIVNDHKSNASIDSSVVQSSESRAPSATVAETLFDLTTESRTLGCDFRAIDTLSLPSLSSQPICVDGSQPNSGIQAATISAARFTSCQDGCLPRPSFLMSWRRRIPKQDEALFFEGCKAAGFNVIDLGSRIYCIHESI